uniref:Slingshot N-terminal domain-containing protein n=1 Tax=Electrophorus electricus TaxID=8005 RepID=A0A4W4HDH8_ELEEL
MFSLCLVQLHGPTETEPQKCGCASVETNPSHCVWTVPCPHLLISENFLTVKGAALFLPRGNGSSPSTVPRITHRWNKHTGDLQQHLQTMFTLLRPEDSIRLAVRLESAYPQYTRYMVVVSTSGRQDTEESVVLGLDFTSPDRSVPQWSLSVVCGHLWSCGL